MTVSPKSEVQPESVATDSRAVAAGSAERVIARAPAAVFAQLVDPTTWPVWLPGHDGWPNGTPPSVAEGATFSQRMGFFGIHDTVRVVVEENRDPTAFAVVADGNLGASSRLSFRLAPAEHNGTLVLFEAELFGTPAGPIAALAQRALRRAVKSVLDDLQAHIESVVAVPRAEGNRRDHEE